jgi:hypothetical protein
LLLINPNLTRLPRRGMTEWQIHLINKGFLYPDGKRVVKNLDNTVLEYCRFTGAMITRNAIKEYFKKTTETIIAIDHVYRLLHTQIQNNTKLEDFTNSHFPRESEKVNVSGMSVTFGVSVSLRVSESPKVPS